MTPNWLMAIYNTGTPADHPKILTMTEGRTKKARHYLKMFPDQIFWESVMAEITASAFLRGESPSTDHPNFKGNLDWLLSKGKDGTENCVKVYEGQYRDGQVIPPHTRPWTPISRAKQRDIDNLNASTQLEEYINAANRHTAFHASAGSTGIGIQRRITGP